MLDNCFTAVPNERRYQPSRALFDGAPLGNRFEDRAFAALHARRDELGLRQIWRCHAARVDGLVETVAGEFVLIEIKETLGWGSAATAAFEFLAGRRLLDVPAKRGIVVFERTSNEWAGITPNGGWGQLALHSEELGGHFTIGALQITPDGQIVLPPMHP